MFILSRIFARRPSLRKWSPRFASLALFALGWELLAHRLHSLLMPTFTETMIALAQLLVTPLLWKAVWISNQAMVLGFALAVSVGLPLGLLMGRWRAAEEFVGPYLSILLATPKSALIPILIMALGLGLASRVLLVFLCSFVAITINTRAGIRLIDPSLIEMAQAFGATEGQLWTKILIRGALPAILTGLRLGLIRAVSGMIAAELLLMALGIGRLILDFQAVFDSANLYATIIVIVAESVILTQTLRWLEPALRSPWNRGQSDD